MNIGIHITLLGMALSVAALSLTSRKPSPEQPQMETLDDATLIECGLWDECDGEPMNAYADEYERRHGFDAPTPRSKG